MAEKISAYYKSLCGQGVPAELAHDIVRDYAHALHYGATGAES